MANSSEYRRKIIESKGSIFLSANTVKPYVAIKMHPEGFLVQGSDELYDEPGVLFAPKVNGAQRVRLPEIMRKYYPELIGAHYAKVQHEGIFFYCPMAQEYRNTPFRLPEGCSYSDVAMPNIDIRMYKECERSEVEAGTYRITLVNTASKTCVLLEPSHKPEKPLRGDIYGGGFAMFMGGVVSYTAKVSRGRPTLSVPQKFFDVAKFSSGATVRRNGSSFLVTPIKDDCFFDGTKIDAAEHEGKKVALCSCCVTDEGVKFMNAVKKVLAEYSRLKTAHETLNKKDVLLPDKKEDIFEEIKRDLAVSQVSIKDAEECLRKLVDKTKLLKKELEILSSGEYCADGTFLPYSF